ALPYRNHRLLSLPLSLPFLAASSVIGTYSQPRFPYTPRNQLCHVCFGPNLHPLLPSCPTSPRSH
ncbi:hypothetical protein HETIRDRAFT_476120, partial [Heterobasidion irregulare TC 32-1]